MSKKQTEINKRVQEIMNETGCKYGTARYREYIERTQGRKVNKRYNEYHTLQEVLNKWNAIDLEITPSDNRFGWDVYVSLKQNNGHEDFIKKYKIELYSTTNVKYGYGNKDCKRKYEYVGCRLNVSKPARKAIYGCILSRLLWLYFKGEIQDGYIIDHKDGNPLNNSLDNLRAIPREDNTKVEFRHVKHWSWDR